MLLLAVVIGGFAMTAAVSEAHTNTTIARIHAGSLRIDAKVTEVSDRTFRIEVLHVSGNASGYVGLATGGDGSCSCGFLGVSHITIDGHARDVLDVTESWDPGSPSPCSLAFLYDNNVIVTSSAFHFARCR